MADYNSILQDLVHSKRSGLESSGGFPPLKANSLFCPECSKNMLSYIAVIRDVLDVVVGEIAEVTPGKQQEFNCPHVKASPDDSEVPTPKRSASSGQKKRRSFSGGPVSAAASEYKPTRIPTFAESLYRNAASNPSTPTRITEPIPVYGTFMVPKEQPTVDSRDLRSDSKDTGTDTCAPVVEKLQDLKLQDGAEHIHSKNAEASTQHFENVGIDTRGPESIQANTPCSETVETNTLARDYNENLNFNQATSITEFAGQNFPEIPQEERLTLQDNYLQSFPFHQDAHDELLGSLEDSRHIVGESASDAVVCETITPRQQGVEGHNIAISEELRDSPVLDVASEQAYVTLATNNLSALSCLVLGYSLLAARTSRSLVVLVGEGVCTTLRYHLSTVFTIVQSIESLGTRETTTISLLEDPEMGISFVKLHVWQLKTFRKCVYLDPDTLVVQNCDELFKRDELSAVPDIGWPDCFNSGVFVYVPSLDTFWDLIEFYENRDSYDGGDQGLLNMFFSNWASDISRKLPFLYNMMANVSYTYKPALKQFGKDVKIVHFFGSYKPWNVPFHSVSGDLLPTANVHPTYVQFVKFWLDIFVSCVMPLFEEEVLNYCQSQVYVTVQDLLRFFHSPTTPETLPVQPSFRVYPESMHEDSSGCTTPEFQESDANEEEGAAAKIPESLEDPSTLPGSELGDYRGMEAWEQGRADYLGQDKSDRIMARLDFLMQGTSSKNNSEK